MYLLYFYYKLPDKDILHNQKNASAEILCQLRL